MVIENEDDPAAEHSRPSIRICKIEKTETAAYGFHLTRTKWDPYPWIAGVEDGSIAQAAGLKVGDCILEVNGQDVIGLRVGEIANKALSGLEHITMLLWNAGSDSNCDSESLCCTPMPTSLSRLSSCLSSVLSFLECPICFEIICPPALQCPMGHLICYRCREEVERCPICRTNFTRERNLLADQIYNAVIEAFHLKNQTTEERTKKLWERVFGKKKREKAQSRIPTPKSNKAFEIKNKFLTRLIGKSSSVENLSSNESAFTPNLRKKSISSSEIYPASANKFNCTYNSSMCGSTESLPSANGKMSRYSSTTNSCETLNASRNFYNRSRGRHGNSDLNVENLFQFSTDISISDSLKNIYPPSDLYSCPLSSSCPAMSSFLLPNHLHEHDGPIIQYFKSSFSINFPFSFGNGAIFFIHCYEHSFLVRLLINSDNDVRMHIWLLGTKEDAEQFKVVSSLLDRKLRTELSFTTFVNLLSTELAEDVYANQITITNSTLKNYFPDQSFKMDLRILQKQNNLYNDTE